MAVDGHARVGLVRATRCGVPPTGPRPGRRRDEPCLGYVFYAPPRAVPRVGRFPTGPVSPDAVLLTSLGVESSQGAADLPSTLIAAVVGDLVRRGVRALEAFGRTAEVGELSDPTSVPSDVAPVMEALGDCSVEQCVLDADLLLRRRLRGGVAPHVLPAAAAGARAGSRVESRCRSGAGAVAAERAAATAGRCWGEPLQLRPGGPARRRARGRATRRT